jgi:hypothetical protein
MLFPEVGKAREAQPWALRPAIWPPPDQSRHLAPRTKHLTLNTTQLSASQDRRGRASRFTVCMQTANFDSTPLG